MSLSIAINRAFCGRPSHLSIKFYLPSIIVEKPALADQPLRQVAADAAGSLAQYCDTAMQPHTNNENSQMYVMRAWLAIRPDLSANQLTTALIWTALVLCLPFLFAWVWAGGGALVATALTAGLLVTIGNMPEQYLQLYLFMLPCALAAVGLYVLGAGLFGMTLGRGFLVVSAIAGLFTGFSSNMRSSHLPLHVGLFALFAVATVACTIRLGLSPAETRRRRAVTLAAWTATGAALFFAAYSLFGAVFIKTLPKTSFNSSYHSIAHPLVLAVAVPPNPLSRREGILWDDSVGQNLARRTKPDVYYIGAGYDDALFSDYAGLWRRHPQEMWRIYRLKAEIAGTGAVRPIALTPQGVFERLLLPVSWITNGVLLLVLLGAVFLASAAEVWRSQSPLALLIGLMAASGAAILVESALIVPYFILQYHSTLLFVLIFLSIVAYWQGLLALGPIAMWAWQRLRNHRVDGALIGSLAALGALGAPAGAVGLSLLTYALLRPWCSAWVSAFGSAGVLLSLWEAHWPLDPWIASLVLLSVAAIGSYATRVEVGWRRGMWLALIGVTLATVGARYGLNPWALASYLLVSIVFLGPASLRNHSRRAPAIAGVIIGASLALAYLVNTGLTVRTRWWEDAIAGSHPVFDTSLGIDATPLRLSPSSSWVLEELRVRAYAEGLGWTAIHYQDDANVYDAAGERFVAVAWLTFPADTVLRTCASAVRHLAGLTGAGSNAWRLAAPFDTDVSFSRDILKAAHRWLRPALIIGIAAAASSDLRTCLWVLLTIVLLAGSPGGLWRLWDAAGAVVILWALLAISVRRSSAGDRRDAGGQRPPDDCGFSCNQPRESSACSQS